MKCKDCAWIGRLSGQWVCGRGKHRFSIVDPEREILKERAGCFEPKEAVSAESEAKK